MDILKHMENSMMRNSITMIEEHFIEQSWAGLFPEPLSEEQATQLKVKTRRFLQFPLSGQVLL